MRIELFDCRDGRLLEAALTLRFAVFVDEQGVPEDDEEDVYDREPATVHALAFEEGTPVGTGRFYEAESGVAQIGRMAVTLPARGAGCGSGLLVALMAEARRRGLGRARLLAQLHALPFYERFGFVAAGEPVLDGGILHRTMEVALGGAGAG